MATIFCSPPGSCCAIKSRRVPGERVSALQLDESLGKLGVREPDAGQHPSPHAGQ
jgi:hypothetical protein